MKPIEIKNAIINTTYLGIDDHGIMTCFLHLDYGASGQSFGGYFLDEYNKVQKQRVGIAFGMNFIISILKTLNITSWEMLKGKHIRVKASFEKIHAIGHILEDKWFYPEDIL